MVCLLYAAEKKPGNYLFLIIQFTITPIFKHGIVSKLIQRPQSAS